MIPGRGSRVKSGARFDPLYSPLEACGDLAERVYDAIETEGAATITGPAGCGKSTVAACVARRWAAGGRDVLWVSVGPRQPLVEGVRQIQVFHLNGYRIYNAIAHVFFPYFPWAGIATSEIRSRFFEHAPRGTLFILDSADLVRGVDAMLADLAQVGPLLSLGRSNPPIVGEEFQMPPPGSDLVAGVVRSRMAAAASMWSEDDVEVVSRMSSAYPGNLRFALRLAYHLLRGRPGAECLRAAWRDELLHDMTYVRRRHSEMILLAAENGGVFSRDVIEEVAESIGGAKRARELLDELRAIGWVVDPSPRLGFADPHLRFPAEVVLSLRDKLLSLPS